ncbi:MAG: CAP domain-containing protein [Pseudonocardia sp.]
MTSLRHAALSAVIVVLVLSGIAFAGPRAGGPLAADARLTTDAGASTAPPTIPPPTGSTVPTATPDATHDAAPDATSRPRPTRTAPRAAAPSRSRTTVAPAPRGDGVARQVLALVNAERTDAGCDPVVLDDRLTAAAGRHSRDMAAGDFLSHTGSDGDSFADRIRAAGHPSPRSENIAAGQESAESVVEAWMDSAGHRENILDCSARSMGVGRASGGSLGVYWTQDFAD